MDNDNFDALKAQYEHPQPKKAPHKAVRLILLSLAGVIIIAAIAIGVLLLVKPKTSSAPTVLTAQQTGGPAANDIVAKLSANPVITNTQNYWQYNIDTTSSTIDTTKSIVYKDANYPFITNVAPDGGLQFTLTAEGMTSSKSTIAAAIKDTLVTNGFSETKQDTTQLSPYKTTTYTNKGTVCQLIDYDGTLALQEQSIVCANGRTIEASYSNVKTLLTKVDESVASLAKVAIQKTVTDGTKKLYDITVGTDDTSKSSEYFFATLSTGYEYLGDRTLGQIDNTSGFVATDQLKKSLADPKWGSFLTDNIKL